MLPKRSVSLLLCAALALSPCVFALPRTALAATVPDNPQGSTVPRIYEGDSMNKNDGTVTYNRGTVINNNGTVANNNGTVTTNNGTVTQNYPGRAVVVNNGTVADNNGTVERNASLGTINYNADSSTVTRNEGTVTTNCGTVETNESGGMVTNNNGTVNTNNGEIFRIYDGRTAGVNNGTVQYNFGTVTTNKSGGTVAYNKGTVNRNEGTVTYSAPSGTVGANSGTVAENSGTVTTNTGNMIRNYGTVGANSGTVDSNLTSATVTTNSGNVYNRGGTVTTNASGGMVANYSGTVTTNASGGTVNNYGGTVTANHGTVTQYYVVTFAGTGVGNMTATGLTDINGAQWAANADVVTLTPKAGFIFAAAPSTTSGMLTAVGSGYRLTGLTGSAAVTVNVAALAAPAFVRHPAPQTKTEGDPATFTVAVSGVPAPTYQWQISSDGAVTWRDVADGTGGTTTAYTTPATTLSMDGCQYRCVATNSQGSTTSRPATLIVSTAPILPTITTAALSHGVVGAAYSQTLVATGTMPITWSIESGALPAGLTLNAPAGEITGTPTTAGVSSFTVKAANTTGSDTQPLSITVNAALAAPTITTQPASQTITAGNAAIFTAAATGNPAPAYQWQVYMNGASAWSNVTNGAGGDTASYTTSATTLSMSGYQYRCVATNSQGSVESGAATLTVVIPAPNVTVSPSSLAFGSFPAGSAPVARVVTVTNTDMRNSIGFSLPQHSDFIITAIEGFDSAHEAIMQPGGSAKFSVQPVGSLPVGHYSRQIGLVFRDSTSLDIPVTFTLNSASSGGSSISGGGADTGNQYAGSFAMGASGALVLTVQAPCEKCVSVMVDGVRLKENTDYSKACGSTVVTFTPAYLATCKDGTHSIRVQFTDGRYDGNFTTPLFASLATSAMRAVPATGGAPIWPRPFVLLGLTCVAYALRRKRA